MMPVKKQIKISLLASVILPLLGWLCHSAYADDEMTKRDKPTIQESFPKDIIYTKKDKIVTLVVENDLLAGQGRDENYTSGVRLGYFDVNADMPALAYRIDDFIPTFDINETSSVFYSVGQNIYTPRNIEQRVQNPGDRPWAAHLYGSLGLVTITDNHLDEIEASVGVVGPAALGEQTQKFIHSHITTKSPAPKGWSNQLKNEPAFLLGWKRRFPQFGAVDFAGLSFSTTPYYGLTLGNVYTFANAGINVRLSPETEKWQDSPARVRPGLPGTGFFEIPEKKWSWYLFAGLEGRAVARNIFLDGNTFTDSYSVDKKYFVADANAGAALTYGSYRVSYTMVYRTKEFRSQDDPSVFGAFSIGYRF